MSDDESDPWWVTLIIGVVIVGIIGGAVVYGVLSSRRARDPFLADPYLDRAFEDAAARDPQARLQSITVTRVDPEGRVHTEHGGDLRADFALPTLRSDGDEPVVLGAPHRAGGRAHTLSVNVDLFEDEGASLDYDASLSECPGDCGPSAPGPLGCTVREVWQRAKTRGAPTPALADLALSTDPHGVRTWRFTIIDRVIDGADREVFATSFPDACR